MSRLARFTCTACGKVDLIAGAGADYKCQLCKPHSIVQKAHAAVARAIYQGELKRASEFSCEDCDRPASMYDHRDYLKPLMVAPVCRRHNVLRGPGLNKDA